MEKMKKSRNFEYSAVRDLSIIELSPSLSAVLACDSSGGAGPLPADKVAATGREVGYWSLKVPLMELLAAGVTPAYIVNTLSIPLNPHGRDIVAGIKDTMERLGFDVPITGSDEVNIPTIQTGVGVTVIGFADPSDLRLGNARSGNTVFAVGTLTGGLDGWARYQQLKKTIAERNLVARPETVLELIDDERVTEVLPVGSRGVRWELTQLADTAKLEYSLTSPQIDLDSSAGPSDLIIVSANGLQTSELSSVTGLPVERVAILK